MITGKTRVCGLIGNPVEHSISPVIHNTLAQQLNLDLVYTTFRVEQERVQEAVKGAYALNILGLNVTVPHKQAVMEALVDVDPLAKVIGAVNTLVRVKDGFKGYNTDILGLKRELEDEQIVVSEKEVVILGAGGAARAIAFLCGELGAKKVYLLNRTIGKALDIAQAVNENFGKDLIVPMDMKQYGEIKEDGYIVIQTTSVGLHPHDRDVILADKEFYQKAAVGVDIIYNPAETRFMQLMEEQGKPAYNGLKMLLYQGVAAFELWNKINVDKKTVEYVLDCMKKELGL